MVLCKAELKAMVLREQSTMLTFFLQQDADVNMADPRGADVTEVDHRGSTCVMLAAGCGNDHTRFSYLQTMTISSKRTVTFTWSILRYYYYYLDIRSILTHTIVFKIRAT